MKAVVIFAILSVLLIAGKALRVRLTFLQRLYLPSSVIGGLVGLAVLTALGSRAPAEVADGMRAIPGFMINIIFYGFVALGAPTAIQDVITGFALLIIVALTTKTAKGAIVK